MILGSPRPNPNRWRLGQIGGIDLQVLRRKPPEPSQPQRGGPKAVRLGIQGRRYVRSHDPLKQAAQPKVTSPVGAAPVTFDFVHGTHRWPNTQVGTNNVVPWSSKTG
uniref:Uncharacterized protein n=1 Tax=Entomoneis paludosa TaxID=265537 RepID=A0A6U3DKL3_9STRA